MITNNFNLLFKKAKEIITRNVRHLLAEEGLSEQQWHVICIVKQAESVNAMQLTEETGILGPSLSRMIESLGLANIIDSRYTDADRRELDIKLTAKGKRWFKRIEPKVFKIENEVARVVGIQTISKLNSALSEVCS